MGTRFPAGDPHHPVQPLWSCAGCADPWPCGPARLALSSEYATSLPTLGIYLATAYSEALQQLHTLDPGAAPTPRELFERFVSWASPLRPVRPQWREG